MSAVAEPAVSEFGGRFLALPDLFPARVSGETWGDEDLDLDFPGGPYRIQGLTQWQRDELAARFGVFARSPEAGDSPLPAIAFRAPASDFRDYDLTGTDYTFDLDYAAGSVRLAGPSWMALYNLASRRGAGFWMPEERPRLFVMVVENFLRVFAAYRAFEAGGAMLHSSCAVKDGRAHLFFGRSGAGKTTLARLCAGDGLTVLSDDMNVVTSREGRLHVECLPFAGELCSRRPAEEQPREAYPLAALYRIVKGTPGGFSPAPRSAMAAQMFVCSSFLNADPLRREEVVSRIETMLAAVPSFTLTFGLDSRPSDFLAGSAA
jgi:hypothetical protein